METVSEHGAINPTNNSIPDQDISSSICVMVLYDTVSESCKIRIWDIILVIPNTIFLIFLFYGLGIAHVQLARVKCPIIKTIYTLVFAVCVIGVARCFVSMFLTASFVKHHSDALATKILWLVQRCFLLGVELSVIIIALFGGHFDSRRVIRRILFITSACAIVYISAQAVLEFTQKKSPYGGKYDVFRYGGMIFWFSSSFICVVIYVTILVLPYTSLRQRFMLPTKKSFYWYCGFLAVMNLIQSIGSVMVYCRLPSGTCMLDVTSFIYFSLFAPLVYLTFLADFFKSESMAMLTSANYSYSYQPIPDNIRPEDQENGHSHGVSIYGSTA